MADWENPLGQESPLSRALRLAMPEDLRNPLLHPEAVNHFALPPQQPHAELRNLPPRPGDYLSPVSEALSPTMGAYGLGNALGDAYVKGREGDYKGMASPLAEILLSMAPVPGMKKGAMPPRVENPIKGFHGSPHEFKPEPGHPIGRFNSEKIGTGEGLQEFGYGHYIAENENTAQGYKRPIWANEHEAPPGHMYEVAIHAPRDRFLNWDAPLSAQSDAVREALAKIDGFRVMDRDLRVMRGSDYALYERPQDALVARFGSPEAASAELSKVGIPGARHVDEAPHNNYVVFPGNEGLIEILRKYGLLGPVAAGATANALMGDKDSQ